MPTPETAKTVAMIVSPVTIRTLALPALPLTSGLSIQSPSLATLC